MASLHLLSLLFSATSFTLASPRNGAVLDSVDEPVTFSGRVAMRGAHVDLEANNAALASATASDFAWSVEAAIPRPLWQSSRHRDSDGCLLRTVEIVARSGHRIRRAQIYAYDVFVGDVVISTQAEADALSCYGAIEGDLTIGGSSRLHVSLPRLHRVSGNVALSGGARRRVLRSLERIGGDLSLGSGIAFVRPQLSSLLSIGGSLRIEGTSLTAWPLDHAVSLGGDLVVHDNAQLSPDEICGFFDLERAFGWLGNLDSDPVPCGGGGGLLIFTRIAGEGETPSAAINNDLGPVIDFGGNVVFAGPNGIDTETLYVGDGATLSNIDIGAQGVTDLFAIDLDDANHVAMSASRTVGPASFLGAYAIDTGGAGFVALREGDVTMFDPNDPFVSRFIALSPNGTVAFSTIRDGHGAIWRGPVGGPVSSLRSGSGTFFNTLSFAVNDAGTVGVQMEYSDPTAGLRRGILMFSTVDPPIDTINTAIEKLGIGVQPSPAINASGQVAFALGGAATLNFYDPPNDTSGTLIPVSLDAGVYVSTPNLFGVPPVLIQIADADTGPFDQFRKVTIDDAGMVVFEATLDAASGWGIYSGPDPVANKVLAVGDTLDGDLISSINLGDLNNNGQIAIHTTAHPSLQRSVWRVSGVHP